MKYTVLTLFPEITDAFFTNSIMARAIKRGIIEYRALNIRDYACDRHKTCDDAPYGGGPGMLMLPEPLGLAIKDALYSGSQASDDSTGKKPCVIYLSPSGRPFNQDLARKLAAERELILICGRYEGIDQRIIDRYVDDEISIGDYVLSSGEVAALVVIDATYRLVDRVICAHSLAEESFSDGLLEYPQFTRPEVYDIMKVPEVLLSGHHEQIRHWRLEKRVEKTMRQRPDMILRGREFGIFNDEINSIVNRVAGDCRRAGNEAEGEEDERNSGY
ncbi:MAG: tRNA (guanosine(37)-N1)-methyltransferase TrmD [Treponema sp.]|jgi:tRNA (guanine37-N1)-methyltransferase|nr:tRNA (guanosine(37)-N1)-methyltransferase TrmD [Treponema sp.]